MIKQYKHILGQTPNEYTSPLEKSDYPEIDTSEELDQVIIKVYQSMICSLQWEISLGRFDIQTATMTMSCIKGQLERLMRMHGYLQRFKNYAIRVCIEEPDFFSLPVQDFIWSDTV
jgi:hypothetical protein